MDHDELKRMEIGSAVRTIRIKRGMSQDELADKAGITLINVDKIENGKYNYPIDVLVEICKALETHIYLEIEK